MKQIQSQISKDRIGFRKLLQLRKKYSLTKFRMDEVMATTAKSVEAQQSKSLKLDNLFVINLDFQDP